MDNIWDFIKTTEKCKKKKNNFTEANSKELKKK